MKLYSLITVATSMIFTPKLVASETIKIHAIHKESFACTEHWDGQFKHVGDALGKDCIIKDWYKDEQRLFMRSFKNNGFQNEDWFGFRKEVLAPCDCLVEKIHTNAVTNQPGIMTPGRASSITFKTADNSRILLAHVREISVKEGQQVKSGEVVARVGNNGYSRNPHIHIGAWDKGHKPLQIRFDQTTIGLKIRKEMKK
jgi:hypothetical protein